MIECVCVRVSVRVCVCVCVYVSLSVVLVYETSPLTLRTGHGLRVFQNRVLRKFFLPKEEEVGGGTGEDRITNDIRGQVASMKGKERAYRCSVAN